MIVHPKFILLLPGILLSMLSYASRDTSYIVKRGDVIDIHVMEHPEFTVHSVYVLPDGTMQYPGFGSIVVAGMSPADLKDTIETALTKYVVNPIVTIHVRTLRRQTVNIFGYVNRPGHYQIFESEKLFDALGLAGGIVDLKRARTIRIIRHNSQMEEVNARKYFRGNLDEADIPMVEAGDIIYVVEPRERINWAMVSAIASLTSTAVVIWRYRLL